MGFFSKIMKKGVDYPELEPGCQAAKQFERIKKSLESATKGINERLEVVPADHGAFVFIGKPPKRFGMLMVEDGEVKNLKSVADQHGLSPAKMTTVVEQLKEAYEHNMDDPLFKAKLGEREVVVHPSDRLEHEVEDILHHMDD